MNAPFGEGDKGGEVKLDSRFHGNDVIILPLDISTPLLKKSLSYLPFTKGDDIIFP
jgi:hypothetical protein